MDGPREVRLIAPAKINWTLEVLGRRPDGYHEVRSVMQTIDRHDDVILRRADDISLKLIRGARGPRRLSRLSPDENLAHRAATLLRERTGCTLGVAIRIHKHVPVAAGLGGGSSDAAAVLRGLRALWRLDLQNDELARIGAELGSDVPFFVRGGTALASGRGEIITPLPEPPEQEIVLAWPQPHLDRGKTARMYASVREGDYTDGSRSGRLAEKLRAGGAVVEEDIYNVFDAVIQRTNPDTAPSVGSGTGLHLCGSGPAVFGLTGSGDAMGAFAVLCMPKTMPAQAIERHTQIVA